MTNGDLASRREFLRRTALWGGLALLSPSLAACLRDTEPAPEPTPKPSPRPTGLPPTALPLATATATSTDEAAVAKVALVRTADRAEGVRRAVALLDSNPVRGKAVSLKPNFNTADPAPGSTHNDTLRTLVTTLQEMGASGITLAERSGPPDTGGVMQQKGTYSLAKELGIEVVNLQELGSEGWVHVMPPDSHWKDGFHFARVYHEAECIVQTCCLKTHAYGGHFTLSLKNSVGMVPREGYSYMREMHSSLYQRQMIAEINTAYTPDLIVLDGVEAFVTGGPDRGTRANAEVMLAGSDRVAIDAVGVAILRLLGTTPEVSDGSIFEQEQIARAVELGLGVASADQIRLVTGDAESAAYADQVREVLLRG